jgi:hypothetical protein
MAKAKRLTMGADSASPTPEQEKERIEVLRATVEKYLPDFARGVKAIAERSKEEKDSTLLLHQDAFAAGYHDDEYVLLGMAVKYAGLYGVTVTVHGTNHETF